MDEAKRGRLQFSIRTLLVVTAATALLLVPVAWVTRERRQMELAQREIVRRREIALRSVIREERRRLATAELSTENSTPPAASNPGLDLSGMRQQPVIEQLRFENSDLRHQLELLRREVQHLRPPARTSGNPGR